MNIENNIFKKCKIDYNKLNNYGFKKIDKMYIFEKDFFNNNFKAIVTVDEIGNISGKVIDIQFDEEYTNIRLDSIGKYVNKVRNSYIDILNDIKTNCCIEKDFIYEQTNRITNIIKKKYLTIPEFLWDKSPDCGVFRNKNKKWFGIVMNIDISKLDNKYSGEVDIINIKLEKNKIKDLLNKKGFYKAYHMNKENWISIVLNDTLNDNDIIDLVEESYNLVKK